MIRFIRSKLHDIRVTGADLNYHGSITLDPEQCRVAGIYPLEFVEIWNKNTGARFSTYVIMGKPGSRCCVLNGAAARSCQVGDTLIIAAVHYGKPQELLGFKAPVIMFSPENRIKSVYTYQVSQGDDGVFTFRFLDENGQEQPPLYQGDMPDFPVD